ncbi:MAG: DUF2029 domain-containing protein [Actinotalea sp.]|nr:DUF2029 domain-containing protein [Actinotalea sp.]
MTGSAATPAAAGPGHGSRATLTRRALVWAAFAVVHAGIVVLGVVVVPAEAFWDVDLYRWWAGSFLGFDEPRPVLDAPWVYPPGALVPVLLPGLVTVLSSTGYALAWSAMVTALDAVVVTVLLRRGATAAALWWLAFLALLGPVSLGRLDAVAVPLAVLGLLAAADGAARTASVLLTAGAWVKVVSGPLLLPVAAAARRPWRDVVAPAAGVSAVVLAVVLALGGTPLGFLTTQTDRGLQAESVGATPWVLGAALDGRSAVVLDEGLVTYEVAGPGAAATAALLDVALPVGVAVAATLLLLARRRGVAAEVLVPASLVLTTWLVVANKVGSPQFVAWLAVPVLVLLAAPRRLEGRTVTAALALVAAALTQAVFPWGYPAFLAGDPLVSGALAARNGVLVALLVLGVVGGVRAGTRRAPALG